MGKSYIIKNGLLVNEGRMEHKDVLIRNDRIHSIGDISETVNAEVIDATGKHILPGIIDGQVHFRDPGLTHKADLLTESRAAVAGGVTSFIEMPNTKPNTLTMELLEEKYRLAANKSVANYGFLLGVTNENIDQVIEMDTDTLLAITDDGLYFTKKGNILADNPEMLEKLLSNTSAIVAIHSEKEEIIEQNEAEYRSKYGEEVPVKYHPIIRSERACYEASERAIRIAKKHNARLHILHLTTGAETELFRNDIPLKEKRITTEVSVHHLWFSDKDYERLGTRIKWNPAIKSEKDREGLFRALMDDRIDFITTDHAPHALNEKDQSYFKSMSGAPMIQHSLVCMLEFYHQNKISLPKIVEKMCHNPAIMYKIEDRGFLREGYYADLTIVDVEEPWTVEKDNLLYKCGWSPLEGTTFKSKVTQTFVNGQLVYSKGAVNDEVRGKALRVDPDFKS
jgi:dihydroorotase